MKGLAFHFFLVAAFCAALGMVWGIQMSASQDHTLSPAHGHLNLLGWVSMGMFGVYYAVTPHRRHKVSQSAFLDGSGRCRLDRAGHRFGHCRSNRGTGCGRIGPEHCGLSGVLVGSVAQWDRRARLSAGWGTAFMGRGTPGPAS